MAEERRDPKEKNGEVRRFFALLSDVRDARSSRPEEDRLEVTIGEMGRAVNAAGVGIA
jgi:hypothetical protein